MNTHKILDNMHLECNECGTIRDFPLCPVCTPYNSSVFYKPRFDGIEAYEETLEEVRPADLLKDKL